MSTPRSGGSAPRRQKPPSTHLVRLLAAAPSVSNTAAAPRDDDEPGQRGDLARLAHVSRFEERLGATM